MKNKKKVYIIIIAVLLVACVAVTAIGVSRSGKREAIAISASDPMPTPRVVMKEVEKYVEIEKEISADIIEDGLRDMGMLVTDEYYFTEVISFSSVKKFLKTDITLGFTETSYLASYDGVVSAGVDFTKLRVEKDDEKGTVTVHIPEAEIYAVDIDPNSFELYSEKAGLGNPVSATDFNNSLVELEATAREKALDRGLLDRADENAKTMIMNFIGGLVDTTVYKISFAA